MENRYIIRLNAEGYYGERPFHPIPKENAIVFNSMKDARKTLNHLNARFYKTASIEKL